MPGLSLPSLPVLMFPVAAPPHRPFVRPMGRLLACLTLGLLAACGGTVQPPVVVAAHQRLNTADISVRADEARQALEEAEVHPRFTAWTMGAGRAPIAPDQSLRDWMLRRSLALSLQGVPRLDGRAHQSLLRALKTGWRDHRDPVCRPLIAGEPLMPTEIALLRTVWYAFLAEQDYQGLLKALRQGAVAALDMQPPRWTTDEGQRARAEARIDADMRRWHGAGWREILQRVPGPAVTAARCEAMADLMLAAENLDEPLRAALLRSWFDPEGGGWPAAWPNPAAPLEAL